MTLRRRMRMEFIVWGLLGLAVPRLGFAEPIFPPNLRPACRKLKDASPEISYWVGPQRWHKNIKLAVDGTLTVEPSLTDVLGHELPALRFDFAQRKIFDFGSKKTAGCSLPEMLPGCQVYADTEIADLQKFQRTLANRFSGTQATLVGCAIDWLKEFRSSLKSNLSGERETPSVGGSSATESSDSHQ